MGRKETFYLWPFYPSATSQLLSIHTNKVTAVLGIRFVVVVGFAFL